MAWPITACKNQTRHNSRATTLFSQLGVDVGSTDLIVLLPNLP